GWGGWSVGADVPPVPWHIQRSTVRAYQGLWSLEYYLSGARDWGTIWVQRSIPATPGTTVLMHIDFWLYSRGNASAGQWAVVAYAANVPPLKGTDFTVVGNTDIGTGWFNYHLDKSVSTGGSSSIYVAFGYSVRWEVIRTDYFDYVTVTRTP